MLGYRPRAQTHTARIQENLRTSVDIVPGQREGSKYKQIKYEK